MITVVTMVMVASWTLFKFHSHFRVAESIANIITSKASTSCVAKYINVTGFAITYHLHTREA